MLVTLTPAIKKNISVHPVWSVAFLPLRFQRRRGMGNQGSGHLDPKLATHL